VVGLTALQHGVQAVLGLRHGGDPRALNAEHGIVCLTGLAAAYGLWRGARWTPPVLAINGLATAVLVVSLGPLLQLDPAARNGLWFGAATIILLFAAAVWYARRTCHPDERSDEGSAVGLSS